VRYTIPFLVLVSALILSSGFVVGLHLLSLMGANQVQRMYDLSKKEQDDLQRQLYEHLHRNDNRAEGESDWKDRPADPEGWKRG
jgi:hypothetical protein